MSDHPLISVIVPVYNVEKYLRDCVDSILNQTYENFELILVDDGSPDSSGKMCDAFAEKDKRIIVLHKENGGLSDARNKGIELARGTYITFIDSDDIVYKEYLSLFVSTMKNEKVEIVQGIFTHNLNELGAIETRNVKVYRNNEAIFRDYLRYKNLQGHACNKLYLTKLFKTLRYPVGKIQEDAWTTYKSFVESDGIAVVFVNTYYYRINNESIMNGKFNPKRFEIMGVPQDIKCYLNKRNIHIRIDNDLEYFTVRLGLKTYNDCIESGFSKKFENELRNTREIILSQNPNKAALEKKYIAMFYLMKCFPRLYDYLITKFRR